MTDTAKTDVDEPDDPQDKHGKLGDVQRAGASTSPTGDHEGDSEDFSGDASYALGGPQRVDAASFADVDQSENESGADLRLFDSDDGGSVGDLSEDQSTDLSQDSSQTVGRPRRVHLKPESEPHKKSLRWLTAAADDESVASDQRLADEMREAPDGHETVSATEPPKNAVQFGVGDSVEGPVMIGSEFNDSGQLDEETFAYIDEASCDDRSEGATGDFSGEVVYVMGEPQPASSKLPGDGTLDETPVSTSKPSHVDEEGTADSVDLREGQTPAREMKTIEEVGRLSDGMNNAVARAERRNRAFAHVDEEVVDEDVLLDESVFDAREIFAAVDDPSGDRSSEDASGDVSQDLSYLMGEPVPAGSTPELKLGAASSEPVDEPDEVAQSDAVISPEAVVRAESSAAADEVCEDGLNRNDNISNASHHDDPSDVHGSDAEEDLSQDVSGDMSGDASYVFGGPKLVDVAATVEEAVARGPSILAAVPSGTADDESVGDDSRDQSMDLSRDSRHGLGKPREVSVEQAADAQKQPGQWATALPGEEIAAPVANDTDETRRADGFPGPVDKAVAQLGLQQNRQRIADADVVDEFAKIEESSATSEETLSYEDDLPGESYFGDLSRDTSQSGLEEVSRDVAYVRGEPQAADSTSSTEFGVEQEAQLAASDSDLTEESPEAGDDTSVTDFSHDVSIDNAEGSSIAVGKPHEVASGTDGLPRRKSRVWLKAFTGTAIVVGGLFLVIQFGLPEIEPVMNWSGEGSVVHSPDGEGAAGSTTDLVVPGETAPPGTLKTDASTTADSSVKPVTETKDSAPPEFDPSAPFFDPNAEDAPLLSDAEKPDWVKAVWARLNDGRFEAVDLTYAEATISKWLSRVSPATPADLSEKLRRLQRQISELSPSPLAQACRVDQVLERLQFGQRTWLASIRRHMMTGQRLSDDKRIPV